MLIKLKNNNNNLYLKSCKAKKVTVYKSVILDTSATWDMSENSMLHRYFAFLYIKYFFWLFVTKIKIIYKHLRKNNMKLISSLLHKIGSLLLYSYVNNKFFFHNSKSNFNFFLVKRVYFPTYFFNKEKIKLVNTNNKAYKTKRLKRFIFRRFRETQVWVSPRKGFVKRFFIRAIKKPKPLWKYPLFSAAKLAIRETLVKLHKYQFRFLYTYNWRKPFIRKSIVKKWGRYGPNEDKQVSKYKERRWIPDHMYHNLKTKFGLFDYFTKNKLADQIIKRLNNKVYLKKKTLNIAKFMQRISFRKNFKGFKSLFKKQLNLFFVQNVRNVKKKQKKNFISIDIKKKFILKKNKKLLIKILNFKKSSFYKLHRSKRLARGNSVYCSHNRWFRRIKNDYIWNIDYPLNTVKNCMSSSRPFANIITSFKHFYNYYNYYKFNKKIINLSALYKLNSKKKNQIFLNLKQSYHTESTTKLQINKQFHQFIKVKNKHKKFNKYHKLKQPFIKPVYNFRGKFSSNPRVKFGYWADFKFISKLIKFSNKYNSSFAGIHKDFGYDEKSFFVEKEMKLIYQKKNYWWNYKKFIFPRKAYFFGLNFARLKKTRVIRVNGKSRYLRHSLAWNLLTPYYCLRDTFGAVANRNYKKNWIGYQPAQRLWYYYYWVNLANWLTATGYISSNFIKKIKLLDLKKRLSLYFFDFSFIRYNLRNRLKVLAYGNLVNKIHLRNPLFLKKLFISKSNTNFYNGVWEINNRINFSSLKNLYKISIWWNLFSFLRKSYRATLRQEKLVKLSYSRKFKMKTLILGFLLHFKLSKAVFPKRYFFKFFSVKTSFISLPIHVLNLNY